jgi:uncharacterized membrane protein YjgN (DUF898 family)
LSGSRSAYGWRFLGYGVLAFVSCGFCVPLMQVRLSRYLYNHMEFGTGRFAFQGSTWPLFRRFLWIPILYLLLVVTIVGTLLAVLAIAAGNGSFRPVNPVAVQHAVAAHAALLIGAVAVAGVLLIAIFVAFMRYSAASLRYIYSRITFEGLQLRYELSAWRLFRYGAGNLLILVFTLGLGFPFVLARMVRIATDNLTIVGTLDFDAIGQNTDPRSRFGEGLASAFDIGAI